MSSNVIALNTDRIDHFKRMEFIKASTSVFYSGQGSWSNFSRSLDIRESDCLRIFLGVPPLWLTRHRRSFFEAVYSYIGCGMAEGNPPLWTDNPHWMPINPRKGRDLPLPECHIDEEFLESFGIRPQIWEKEILIADLNAAQRKPRTPANGADTNLRLYLALSMFGFSDPSQFFVF